MSLIINETLIVPNGIKKIEHEIPIIDAIIYATTYSNKIKQIFLKCDGDNYIAWGKKLNVPRLHFLQKEEYKATYEGQECKIKFIHSTLFSFTEEDFNKGVEWFCKILLISLVPILVLILDI